MEGRLEREGRGDGELRTLILEREASPYAEGSCLIALGETRVLCSASVEESVPRWREDSGSGWVTAEYGMLPRSTHSRRRRNRDGADGRTREIERLIGRSLRSVTDLEALGPRTVIVDCDVLQADGGTRTASITGGCVALSQAFHRLYKKGELSHSPLREPVAAVSVGLVDDRPILDLDYREDVRAQVDLNVVATGNQGLVEVQGTAEGDPFSRASLDQLLDLAFAGIRTLIQQQGEMIREVDA